MKNLYGVTAMNPRIIKTNIQLFGALSNDNMPFGRKIETFQALKDWKQNRATKSAWASQKRKSLASAIKEVRDLNGAKQYYAELGQNDDSFQIFYRA